MQAGLWLSAFTSATILPGSSEAVLVAALAGMPGAAASLVAVATAGNVLGSLVNWVMGRFFAGFRDRPWFPVPGPAYDRAVSWYGRYGSWSLLLSWFPVIGDPLTVAAGVLRVHWVRFLVLVALGKLARYAFIAGAFAWWNGT
ncbi:MAG: DedA family protein [Alphaproteobacteria bacterium]|nr:DedA family protein [Alphaproteobacteria bacterium]